MLCSADSTGRYGASSDSHQPKVGKTRHETIGNEVCKFGKVHGQEVLDGAARHRSMQPLGGKLQYSETVDSAMKRNSEMKRFINEYIHSTKPLRSSEELRGYFTSNTFDCIVVGSDQVWREIYSPCIEDFFLGFLPEDNNTLNITYAASFGTADSPISDEHLANCIGLSGRFSAISVREQSGVEIMKNIFGHESKLVLDPTLLLTAKQYTFPLSQCPKGEVCCQSAINIRKATLAPCQTQ